MTDTLIMFVKHPISGLAKTRLCDDIGSDEGLLIYSKIVQLMIKEHNNAPYKFIIDLFPAQYKNDFIEKFGYVEIINQSKVSYAHEAQHIIKQTKDSYDKIIYCVSDTPHVTRQIITNAFKELEVHDTVFGPATDGNSYLIGIRRGVDVYAGLDIFDKLPLMTAYDNIKKLRLTCKILETLPDVDYGTDLTDDIKDIIADK